MSFEPLIARRYLQGKLKLGVTGFIVAVILIDLLAVLTGVLLHAFVGNLLVSIIAGFLLFYLVAGIAGLVYIFRSGRTISLIAIISSICIYGINVGVWALICVLSVFNGFNGIVKSLLVGFDPHLRVTPVEGRMFHADSIAALIRTQEGVTAAAPFVSGRSAIINKEGLKVIQVRGMRQADVNTAIGLGRSMVTGSFVDSAARSPHTIVLGRALSFALHVSRGDTISLLSQGGLEEALTQLSPPTIVRCVVTGIFESSNKEYDSYYAYTNLSTARELFAVPSGAMGIEVRLDNLENAERFKPTLQHLVGAGYRVETWQDLHRDLFNVMELERWAAFIILSLIIIVAVFNVLGSLTMTVIEKQRDIGILKTMGASDRSIRRIFIRQGALIGVIGTCAGMVKGVTICLLQQHYGFFTLDNSVYIIPALPVELRVSDIVIIGVTALVLAIVAAIYPARRASGILPADAVRWE